MSDIPHSLNRCSLSAISAPSPALVRKESRVSHGLDLHPPLVTCYQVIPYLVIFPDSKSFIITLPFYSLAHLQSFQFFLQYASPNNPLPLGLLICYSATLPLSIPHFLSFLMFKLTVILTSPWHTSWHTGTVHGSTGSRCMPGSVLRSTGRLSNAVAHDPVDFAEDGDDPEAERGMPAPGLNQR